MIGRTSRATEALANLPVLGLLAFAALLVEVDPDAYRRIVEEDGVLEWLTFWSFLGAAAVHGRSALAALRPPWFLAGLALFCLWVALEEISWGQRLLGFRPPDYFLAQNFQQEFNLHNTIDDGLRQLGFLTLCLAYGVVLPLCRSAPTLRRWLDSLAVVAPPVALIPAFTTTAILYQLYPWEHTGEWAEAMLGSTMLFAAVLHSHAREARGQRDEDAPAVRNDAGRRARRHILGTWALTLLLGIATPILAGALTRREPERREQARIELEALRRDFALARTRTRCGVHKRIYTLVVAYQQDHLYEGEFAGLRTRNDQAVPEARARYFLDPWNSPYWVQHVCSSDRRRRAIFVYSMGPNRRRDSSDWKIVQDDLGAWISRPTPIQSD